MTVTGKGATHEQARTNAYRSADLITWKACINGQTSLRISIEKSMIGESTMATFITERSIR